MWWGNNEHRKNQKENIKTIIKRTKLSEKVSSSSMGPNCANSPPGLSHSVPTSDTYSDAMGRGTRAVSVDSQCSLEFDFNQTPMAAPFDPYAAHMQAPHYGHFPHFTPYEVDIKTERQMYVNDVPTRRDSTISTFSTFQPPPPHATLPSFPGDDWVQEEYFESRRQSFSGEEGLDFDFFDFSHGATHIAQNAMIPVDEADRPLLDHFVDNVLRLIFPILEVNQHGSARSEVILPALESNKCYLHCCLSIAAVHLKSTQRIQSEQLDNDIMRHRFETITELCKALDRDTDHLQILEAALGMIFFQCSVGRPDDALPDIAWHQHFEAATSLIQKLDLPRIMVESEGALAHPPFNMTLASWVDILGSTMIGRTPKFAHTYRTKHLGGSTSGLAELMGCEDRIMYLISEIVCLEALKLEGSVNDTDLNTHVFALGQQLDHTEPPPGTLQSPYSSPGALRPKQLSKNMTAVFRIAARVYLCSLINGFDRYSEGMICLINRLSEILEFIPAGPDGFDRSLVWPLLICGSFSTPESSFRHVFADRVARLGEHAEFGSFGRMVCLLNVVWRQADEPTSSCTTPTTTPKSIVSGDTNRNRKQNVHWRDVMRQNGWDFLLI
jgi:hypothetical protein